MFEEGSYIRGLEELVPVLGGIISSPQERQMLFREKVYIFTLELFAFRVLEKRVEARVVWYRYKGLSDGEIAKKLKCNKMKVRILFVMGFEELQCRIRRYDGYSDI